MGAINMTEYFTVENCTAEQLEELKCFYFWNDDPDIQENLEIAEITNPHDIPDYIIFQEYARILFTSDDFLCTSGNEEK